MRYTTLIAMIVTEAQDRALAQMPGPEAPLGDVQPSDAFLRRMDALVHTANRRANRQHGRLAIKRFLVALATALSLFSCTMLPVVMPEALPAPTPQRYCYN